jgi:hypothetical protein
VINVLDAQQYNEWSVEGIHQLADPSVVGNLMKAAPWGLLLALGVFTSLRLSACSWRVLWVKPVAVFSVLPRRFRLVHHR